MKRAILDSGDRLHSVESAAQFLGGVSVSTIRNWLSLGRLTRVKIGRLVRIRESELLQMIGPARPSARQKGAASGSAAPPPKDQTK